MDLLQIQRRIFTDKSTIGELFFDGSYECATLEDPCRLAKLHGITAIPPGRYKVVISESKRFKRLMPRILEVPGYEGVLIHWGNFPQDTEGCVLVGQYDPGSAADFISNSRKTFEQLFAKLEGRKNEDIFISINGGHSHFRQRAD